MARMPLLMKARFLTAALLLGLLLFVLIGCGDEGDSGSASLAEAAPAGTPVFVEATVRPEGELKANVETIAQTVGGIDDLGDKIVSELESSAGDEGESLDYKTEVEPWLGEKVGVFLDDFTGDEFERVGVVVQTTDTEAAQAFVDKRAEDSDDPVRDASYEGVDYKVDSADESVYGMVGDLLVVSEEEQAFKDAVTATDGESLDDDETFGDTMSNAVDGSLADVYVDVGRLIEQSGSGIDPRFKQVLSTSGIEAEEATAVASVVPEKDRVEIDVSGDLGDQEVPTGDAAELLETLPADSFAALGVSGFGEQLQEALDGLDREGVSGTVPPHQLKKGVKELGIDLEGLVGSLRDAAVFASGSNESSLGGALVLTAEGSDATEAVERAVTLMRAFNVGGVTVLGGKTTGFAVHSDELGPKPLVVATKEGRVAIGYGVPQTLSGLAAPSGHTLADNPAFKDAVDALEGTPITGFADGAGALQLADALVPSSETDYREAKPYLRHISFVAIGSGSDGDRATAKLIVGLNE
jgi:hypothetical protein